MLNTCNTLHIHNRISILYLIHITRYTETKYEAHMPIALRTAILTRYVLSYRSGIGMNRDPQYPNPYKSCFSTLSCFMLNTHNTISIICYILIIRYLHYTRYIQYDNYNMLNTCNTLHIHNRISILY